MKTYEGYYPLLKVKSRLKDQLQKDNKVCVKSERKYIKHPNKIYLTWCKEYKITTKI